MPAVNDYAARKAASVASAGVSRKTFSPLVEEIRAAYLQSRSAQAKAEGHISGLLPREPGEDREEVSA